MRATLLYSSFSSMLCIDHVFTQGYFTGTEAEKGQVEKEEEEGYAAKVGSEAQEAG